MDVDTPNTLKRCSSAPLINEASTAASSPTTNSAPRDTACFSLFGNSNQHRTRRFSASCSPLAQSPNACGPRLTPRVNQLRREECAELANTREAAHEREIHSAMQMSQSWEDLTLMTAALGGSPTRPPGPSPSPASPAASPSPAVSPSPTRRAFATRRSLSPVALRPSRLSPVGRGLACAKRRFDVDEPPAAKRSRRSPERPPPPLAFTFRPVSPRAQRPEAEARGSS